MKYLEKDIDTIKFSKIKVCCCKQCKYVKNKRKNRNLKKRIKRLLNKKLRKSKNNKIINFYWA